MHWERCLSGYVVVASGELPLILWTDLKDSFRPGADIRRLRNPGRFSLYLERNGERKVKFYSKASFGHMKHMALFISS